jgi:hypothetical protein
MKLSTLLAIAAAVLIVAVPFSLSADEVKALTGKLSKVEEKSVTVDAKDGSKTLALTDSTKVVQKICCHKSKDATKADLKVGQEVTISPSGCGKQAVQIVIAAAK